MLLNVGPTRGDGVECDLMNCGDQEVRRRMLVCDLETGLVKKVVDFCPCLKSLLKAKVKEFLD